MRIKLPSFLFIIAILASLQIQLEARRNDPKLLILIISSDNIPELNLEFPYRQLQGAWKSYMHSDPKHVEAYFIRANPNLASNFDIAGDVLWSKTDESVIPGILNKTLLSLEYFAPRLHEFDFVLRTNLSSFYVLPKLLNFLKGLPRKNCYCASGDRGFGSGCGYIISTDVANILIKNKKLLYNSSEFDDVKVGYFLISHGVALRPAPRTDFVCLSDWLKYKMQILPDAFHYRIKNTNHDLRATDDLLIIQELIDLYYP